MAHMRGLFANLMRPLYKIGDKVPQSGIYDIVHGQQGTQADEDHLQVTCVRDEHFPPCRHCKDHIGYRLFKAAHHLNDHPHLLGKR